MSALLDDTHDPALQSWLESANTAETDFPIQNLPFGRFRRDEDRDWRIGVAIGDQVLDLRRARLIETYDLNRLMRLAAEPRRALRQAISAGLRRGSADEERFRAALVPQEGVEMGLPCAIGDYTDFYTSIHHATTVGRQFRPDNPLLPNYKWVPIGYHGRASTIQASGHAFARPSAQLKGPQDDAPRLAPTQRLDYELELGLFIGRPNAQGTPITIDEAEDHVFGVALFNDWSARDVQAWEYQPLGPFLSKNFASTVSPWIVTMEALAPFRKPFVRPAGDPQPLPYLDSALNPYYVWAIGIDPVNPDKVFVGTGTPTRGLTLDPSAGRAVPVGNIVRKLCALDSVAGDGDHGFAMGTAAKAIRRFARRGAIATTSSVRSMPMCRRINSSANKSPAISSRTRRGHRRSPPGSTAIT